MSEASPVVMLPQFAAAIYAFLVEYERLLDVAGDTERRELVEGARKILGDQISSSRGVG